MDRLNVTDASKQLKVSRETVYKWLKQGKLTLCESSREGSQRILVDEKFEERRK